MMASSTCPGSEARSARRQSFAREAGECPPGPDVRESMKFKKKMKFIKNFPWKVSTEGFGEDGADQN